MKARTKEAQFANRLMPEVSGMTKVAARKLAEEIDRRRMRGQSGPRTEILAALVADRLAK